MLSKILPEGTREIYSVYDAFSRETRFGDARGKFTRHNYDRNNNVIATILPSGSKTDYLYNESRRTAERDNDGQVVRYNYDALQHIETSFKPMGQVTRTCMIAMVSC